MMTDPIADMLTRIRNAFMARKKEVVLPFSKIKLAIAELLIKEGYMEKAEKTNDKKPLLILKLKYDKDNEPAITLVRRVSSPGHRRYVKSSEIASVLNGYGLSIISTPKGLMTNRQARKEKMGGEIICEVY
jgi:small subunit ribosomal protein S8